MKENIARKTIVETGIELVENGLVARTWGNVSCRLDDKEMMISPSGLDYLSTTEEDIAKVNIETGEWTGKRKPSGERKVHLAAYQTFPEVEFVIHTHQDFASALSISGFDKLDISEEEKQILGGIALADYGLPGTKKLTSAVRSCFESGHHTVLMEKHGVVVCGTSKEEAMQRVDLLETICKRNIKANITKTEPDKKVDLLAQIQKNHPKAAMISSPYILSWAETEKPIIAQLDDMAQMIGRKIPVVNDLTKAQQILQKHNAVIIKGYGAIVNAEDEGDVKALKLLVNKSALSALNTAGNNEKATIPLWEVWLMNFVYKKKYSKQRGA